MNDGEHLGGRVLHLCPMTLRESRDWVNRVHRHHIAPQGGLFAIGAATDIGIVGCAIVGRPVARNLDDSWTAEVTRCATDGTANVCSLLYAACWRACRSMGYRRLITYTLASEPGTSLVAAGWHVVAEVRGRSWHCVSRPRVDRYPEQDKMRWEMAT